MAITRLDTLFRTHAATTMRIVTVITLWFVPGSDRNPSGFSIANRKDVHV